ncbi:MAG TPA: DUF5060 domain-containing protein [Candidatus Acidoferrum sp.]|nr:DUF5060 domain-containing protein [Candidatus Acidoferrum sp.]
MARFFLPLQILLLLILAAGIGGADAAPAAVRFSPNAVSVDVYDFLEVTLAVERPDATNPFTEVEVTGEFGRPGSAPLRVDGFCDSPDGRIYQIRFMPAEAGTHHYSVTFKQGEFVRASSGTFEARPTRGHGRLRVDPAHPFHFVWEGTGEHYFYNSTTAYWLLGWRDEAIIRESIDRLVKLRINRIRVALNGRTTGGSRWKEDTVQPGANFQFRLEPWPAARPENVEDPGYDVTRFNVDLFRKCERMLRYARERGLAVSLIFYLDGEDKGVDPFGKAGQGGPDEQRYYRYVIARFGCFANVLWDVTNEWHLFRDEAWVNQMGAFVKACDPYQHLTTVHGRGDFPFRKSPWADYAEYQSWDEHGGYPFMLRNRREQAATGRPIPQVNEEYGYEDSYPYPWGEGRRWPARIADNRRRLAWEMVMAGGYQTTGERANIAGYGGWINGRGNAAMTMLRGYAHLRDFFESIPWWTLEPHPELTDTNALCLAEPGRRYVLYFQRGNAARLRIADGDYQVKWFNPRTGDWRKLKAGPASQWQSPVALDAEDWVLLLERKRHA